MKIPEKWQKSMEQNREYVGQSSSFGENENRVLFLLKNQRNFWPTWYLSLSENKFDVFCIEDPQYLPILFMGFSRQEYWSGLPFPSPVDHILSDLSTMTRPSWVAPHGMALFHWVKQAVVHVIRLASCLWLWFQSVCPLMPSLSAYHLIWVSLTLDVGYFLMTAPTKHSRCSLPWTWVAPLGHSCAITGWHSQPLPLTSDVG